MQVLLQRINSVRNGLSMLGALVFGAFLGLLIYQGGLPFLVLLAGLCGAALLTALAYFRPLLTIGLWALLTGIAEEVTALYLRLAGGAGSLALGAGIDMRLSDPILLGVAGALLVKLAVGDQQSRERMLYCCFFWLLLTSWLLFGVVRSISDYGIVSAIGEFRTGFEELLILPYLVVFVPTRQQQRRLFGLLLIASLAFIAIGLVAGGALHGFSFAAYDKWLRAPASLALVLGALALYLSYRHGLWKRSSALLVGLLGLVLALTIINSHRSVWMATALAFAFLVAIGAIPLSRTLSFSAGLLLCGVVLSMLYAEIDLLAFVNERLMAFTSYSQDSSANWRMQLWVGAWEASQAHLWEGKGFGSYFRFYNSQGNLITVSLHNQYLQLIYQVGLIGLTLYLLLVVRAARQLWTAHAAAADRFARLATLMGLTALVASSAYHLVYGFEPFTWLYVGLGLAVAASLHQRR